MYTIILSTLKHVITSHIMCIVISELVCALKILCIQGVELENQYIYASYKHCL